MGRMYLCLGLTAVLSGADMPLIDPLGHGLGPAWRYDHITPEDPLIAANWKPMSRQGGRWRDPVHLTAGAPFVQLLDHAMQLQTRAPYDGDALNNLEKWAAVVFTAPESGVYQVTGELDSNRFEGSGGLSLHIYVRQALPAPGTVLSLAEWQLPPHAVQPIGLGPVRLARGEELAFMPRCLWRQSGADVILRNVTARIVP